MRTGCRLLVVGCVGCALSWAVPGTAGAATESCGEISFAPGSTLSSSAYGVGDIMATDVGCDVATAVAGAARENPNGYTLNGFKCTETAEAPGPGAKKNWTCTRAAKAKAKAKKHKKKNRKAKAVPPATVTFYSIGV